MSTGLILGSAFAAGLPDMVVQKIDTPSGLAELYKAHDGWLLFRHGLPHNKLPHQINYRANAWALKHVGVDRLVVTSSVGVMHAQVPLNTLLTLSDLLMLDNRLPTGEACTIFDGKGGHLVLLDGMFDSELTASLRRLAKVDAVGVVFAYVGGPRTKTPAENRYLASAGAQVNSMTVGPEVVLANELEIPCAGLVIGHKYSHPDIQNPGHGGVSQSLEDSRKHMESLIPKILNQLQPTTFKNEIFRF